MHKLDYCHFRCKGQYLSNALASPRALSRSSLLYFLAHDWLRKTDCRSLPYKTNHDGAVAAWLKGAHARPSRGWNCLQIIICVMLKRCSGFLCDTRSTFCQPGACRYIAWFFYGQASGSPRSFISAGTWLGARVLIPQSADLTSPGPIL